MHRYLCVVPAVLGVLLVACGSGPTTEPAAPFQPPLSSQVEPHAHEDEDDHAHIRLDESTTPTEMAAALVASELVVGPNRFAVGLFDDQGAMVHAADVHFHYYDLSDPAAPVLESHAQATRLQTPDGLTTIFAHEREFARAGEWGVEIQAHIPDGAGAITRIGFSVLDDSAALMPGESAPALDTQTLADTDGDFDRLTSAQTPNPAFYSLGLQEALTNGKPTLIIFATPAFCRTRFCGPAYESASVLQETYGDQLNFIHVEVYTGLPNPAEDNWQLAPAMVAFGLITEPWLYLIDPDGVVVYRVEGMFTTEEVGAHIRELVHTEM